MDDKIKRLEDRIMELKNQLTYASVNSDIRSLSNLLALNETILAMLKNKDPIHFYKPFREEIPLEAGFFLPTLDS